jgi:hypothetical protein
MSRSDRFRQVVVDAIPIVKGEAVIVLALLSGVRAFATYPTATNSGPIAITKDDRFVWVVNRERSVATLWSSRRSGQMIGNLAGRHEQTENEAVN